MIDSGFSALGNSGIDGHIQQCFWHFHNPLYPWRLQNYGIFRAMANSEPGAYLKLCQTSTMECFVGIVKGSNYFCKISFSRFLLYEINIMNF